MKEKVELVRLAKLKFQLKFASRMTFLTVFDMK